MCSWIEFASILERERQRQRQRYRERYFHDSAWSCCLRSVKWASFITLGLCGLAFFIRPFAVRCCLPGAVHMSESLVWFAIMNPVTFLLCSFPTDCQRPTDTFFSFSCPVIGDQNICHINSSFCDGHRLDTKMYVNAKSVTIRQTLSGGILHLLSFVSRTVGMQALPFLGLILSHFLIFLCFCFSCHSIFKIFFLIISSFFLSCSLFCFQFSFALSFFFPF